MPQTEVMALESLAMALTLRGEVAEAEPWIDRATQAARQASSRRYLSIDLLLRAHCRQAQGRGAEARTLLAEALELAQQTGIGFIGPSLYAALALASDDPAERRRCLAEGEALLAGDCLAHARLMFYRDAIDAELAAGHLEAALRHADALEACAQAEPLAVARLGAARARALVALRRDGASAPLVAELRRLADDLRRVGMGAMARGIEVALTGV
jgi:ATP/maltotriose-dependent transcriptional regulator MalT